MSAEPPPLPDGWTAGDARASDVPALHALRQAHDRAAVGRPVVSREDVAAGVVGRGAAARQHRVLRDAAGTVRAWGSVQDRAAGRVLVTVLVDPDLDDFTARDVAASLFAWAEARARVLAADRHLESTQLDSGAFAEDVRQQRWLVLAGYAHVRTWWQMSRPVDGSGGDASPPLPGDGVVLRQVVDDRGDPAEDDVRRAHDVLEAAFTDHFNYHQESFDEFVARQREDAGHAWDHWWLAEVMDDGVVVPAGALVGTVLTGADGQPDGSYVDYLGVTRAARGRGVARSLLLAVIADAAARGRGRVGLEVDADSPTGATALYASLGFSTTYVTESWHRDVVV